MSEHELNIRESKLPEGFLFLPSFRETYNLLRDAYKKDSRIINNEVSDEEKREIRIEWRDRAWEFLEAVIYYGVYGELKPDLDVILMSFMNECTPVIDYCKRQRDKNKN